MSSTELLDQLLARVSTMLPPEEVEKLRAQAAAEMASLRWIPNPGAQTLARDSLADQLLFGGKAGGGKSDVLIGLACTQHKRSLLLRRLNREVHFLVDRTEEILGHAKGLNAQLGRWYLPDDRLLMFGGCQHAGDEKGYKGEPKDLIGIDEASEFLESQIDFLSGWLRSKDPKQRVRLVLATNPPTTVGGEWIQRWFAPWTDPHDPLFPYPVGELLYFERMPDGIFRWSEQPFDVTLPNGKTARALSRTFIPAELEDNPDYAKTDYAARLAALPEEMRRRYERGDFTASASDADNQVIPTQWITAAQARWKPDGFTGIAMTAMGFDPAGGGRDSAELAWRYGGWYAPIVSAQGPETADGSAAAATIIAHRRDSAPVVVDAGGGAGHGFGGTTIMRLRDNGIAVEPFNGASSSLARTKDRLLRFANKRAEAWWKFREELDPDQEGGAVIALPPDSELRADLAAPTYQATARGILVEDKKEIRKRIGRSPGKGDAVVMCLSEGHVAVKRALRASSRGDRVQSYTGGSIGTSNMRRRNRS